jgi:hypothetical protein
MEPHREHPLILTQKPSRWRVDDELKALQAQGTRPEGTKRSDPPHLSRPEARGRI